MNVCAEEACKLCAHLQKAGENNNGSKKEHKIPKINFFRKLKKSVDCQNPRKKRKHKSYQIFKPQGIQISEIKENVSC